MNLPYFIAKRYFQSKKKRNFINVISKISMFGVAIGTMALVIALSVMNGLKENIRSLYGSFDPEIKISASSGKSFEMTEALLTAINSVEGVELVTEVVEDNALIEYQDDQVIVKIKGVGENFLSEKRLKDQIIEGELKLSEGKIRYAIIGRATQLALSIPPENEFNPLKVYYPKALKIGAVDPGDLFKQKSIMPGAVFAIEQQYTEEYVFVPLDFALDLFGMKDQRTSLEIKTGARYNVKGVQRRLKSLLGSEFEVLNGDEQHASLLRAIRIEKLFVFLVFSFILAIASFNTFFALTMLGIEKKKDMAILHSLGASRNLIKRIFLSEGAIIAFTGAFFGLLLGLTLLFLQQEFGLVSMGMQSSILEAYPVKMQFTDFLYTAISIIIITFLASYRPALQSSRIKIGENL
ncbi:MAG: ABC transporter permease [Cytophagales bacterium]|nr:ABC transporter permease [Cytophagales bacterium]